MCVTEGGIPSVFSFSNGSQPIAFLNIVGIGDCEAPTLEKTWDDQSAIENLARPFDHSVHLSRVVPPKSWVAAANRHECTPRDVSGQHQIPGDCAIQLIRFFRTHAAGV